MKLGRIGLVIARWLFEKNFMPQYYLNPFYITSMAMIIYMLTLVIFTYNLEQLFELQCGISALGFAIFLVHPLWIEQLYFTLQLIPIALGILLVCLSAYFSFKMIIDNKIGWGILATILLIWGITIYQLFTVMYVSLIIIYFLLYLTQKGLDTFSFIDCIVIVSKFIIIFLLGFFLSQLLARVFMEGTYIDGQVLWGKVDKEQNIRKIKEHFYVVFNPEYNKQILYIGYRFSIGISGVALLLNFKLFKKWLISVTYISAWIVFF